MMQAQKVLAEKMTTVCFERCISGPTEKLSDKQRRCLDACTSSFLEGFQIAVRHCHHLRTLTPPWLTTYACIDVDPFLNLQTETVQNIAKKEAASSHE